MTKIASRILVVDDEEVIRFAIDRFFSARGYKIDQASSVAEARSALATRSPDLVLLDHNLPDGSALDVLGTMAVVAPSVPSIVLTAHGSIELAVAAIKQGAEQFFTKPVKLEVLAIVVERLLSARRAMRTGSASRIEQQRTALDPFAGSSPAIRKLREVATAVVDFPIAVLLEGETGTGKGILARWLHDQGPRSEDAFVALNCAGLPKDLLESELFGHEKGAFTGAASAKQGLLEVAHRGTLFLDEIGDMNLEMQPRLLKVLEDQCFRRVGAVRERQVDVRLLAATHYDLADQCNKGLFRPDLFYRINSVRLTIPPLRDREDDVLALSETILMRLSTELNRPGVTLSSEAQATLLTHDWPGNVRELRNVLERALLFARSPVIEAANLQPLSSTTPDEQRTAPRTLREVERKHIEKTIEQNRDIPSAALQLGLSRSALYKLIKRHSITLPARRPK